MITSSAQEMMVVLPELRRGRALAASNRADPWAGRAGFPMVASPRSYMPPLPEDQADLFNAGEAGHEKIEQDALGRLGVSAERVAGVYFGNWQRDMSQVLVPAYHNILGRRAGFLCDLLFEVLDVMAEARFGWRLDRVRFGTYRWEEHIDNPRDFGVAIDPRRCAPLGIDPARPEIAPDRTTPPLKLWAEGPEALPAYLHVSRQYVARQLSRVLALSPASRSHRLGLEHFGNAMHVVEDMYAHSNFIELGLRALGRNDVNPMTGVYRDSRRPILDSLGRYRLTTGVFLLADTLVSLEKLLLQHIEGRAPGSPPSNLNQRIVRVLIRRLLGDRALSIYDGALQTWQATGIPGAIDAVLQAIGVRDLQRRIEELVFRPLRAAIAQLLQPIVEASRRQTGNKPFRAPIGANGQTVYIIETSHSRLAKDDPYHVYHDGARRLAIHAVQDFWREMETRWRAGHTSSAFNSTQFPTLIRRYMNHPHSTRGWWEPILRSLVGRGRPMLGSRAAPAIVPPSQLSPRPARGRRFRRRRRIPRLRELELWS